MARISICGRLCARSHASFVRSRVRARGRPVRRVAPRSAAPTGSARAAAAARAHRPQRLRCRGELGTALSESRLRLGFESRRVRRVAGPDPRGDPRRNQTPGSDPCRLSGLLRVDFPERDQRAGHRSAQLPPRRQCQRRHHRDLVAVGPAVRGHQRPAQDPHQPLRSAAARLGRGRDQERDLRVLERREAAADDARRRQRHERGRDALRAAAGRRVPAGRERAGRRRPHQLPHRQAGSQRQVRDGVGQQGRRARTVQRGARPGRRSQSPHLRRRSDQQTDPGVRRERQVSRGLAEPPVPQRRLCQRRDAGRVGQRQYAHGDRQVRHERPAALLVGRERHRAGRIRRIARDVRGCVWNRLHRRQRAGTASEASTRRQAPIARSLSDRRWR